MTRSRVCGIGICMSFNSTATLASRLAPRTVQRIAKSLLVRTKASVDAVSAPLRQGASPLLTRDPAELRAALGRCGRMRGWAASTPAMQSVVHWSFMSALSNLAPTRRSYHGRRSRTGGLYTVEPPNNPSHVLQQPDPIP